MENKQDIFNYVIQNAIRDCAMFNARCYENGTIDILDSIRLNKNLFRRITKLYNRIKTRHKVRKQCRHCEYYKYCEISDYIKW